MVPMTKLSMDRIAPRLELPLLVIHDRDDREVPWVDGASIADASPRASLLSTEGLGHRRILRDPKVIEAAIAFLDRDRCEAHHRPRSDGRCDACGLERDLFERSDRPKPPPASLAS